MHTDTCKKRCLALEADMAVTLVDAESTETKEAEAHSLGGVPGELALSAGQEQNSAGYYWMDRAPI